MRISDWSSDVCSSDLRLHREVAAGVAGYADLRIGAEQTPRLLRIAVALPQMDAVGADPLRQRHLVVDDEGGVVRGADRLQRLGEPRRRVLLDVLDAKLEGRARPRGYALPQPGGKTPHHADGGGKQAPAGARG